MLFFFHFLAVVNINHSAIIMTTQTGGMVNISCFLNSYCGNFGENAAFLSKACSKFY